MSHLVMLLLTLSLISTILIGCSNSSNPVTPSETQTSGALQYTFATPKTTYNPGDTLTAAVTVHNPGFSTDTIAVRDGIFEWALVTSSGDTVMIGGGANNVLELVPVLPGQSKEIYSLDRVLSEGSGQTFPSGSYSLKATVRPMSFLLKLSVQ